MSEKPNPPADKKNSPPSGGPGKLPRPPIQTLIFWLVVFFALPIILYFTNRQTKTDVDQLKVSNFETLLHQKNVLTANVEKDPTSGITVITGNYLPLQSATQEGPKPETRSYRVEVIYSDALDEMLRKYCPEREIKTHSNLWTTILVSLLPILVLVIVIYFLFSRQLRSAGKGALQFGKSRARLMTPNQEKVTFDDVSGIEEAKEEVEEIIDYLRDPQKFQRLGGHIPKGVLMIGPPGTGKTLLARAIAGEADVAFFSISGSDFVEMFVGVGASRVRDMFEEGKRRSPCLIFIDEIDAVGRSRFSGIGGGHDEREQTLNALLVEMDGFESNSGVIVIAATNRPDVLDPALLRPGRFDRQIAIDLPDVNGRLGILKVHARKVQLVPEVDLKTIAKGTPGYSGADLANLVNEAALLAARQNKTAIDMSDLEEARDKVRWGKERRSRKIDEKDRRITAFHEAGHALVGMLCKQATPLHKVTIIPRGNAYLGATMHLPERDRYTQSLSELQDELAVMMAGRVAEALVFQDITSGAAMDIRQATDLAKKMVCQWGMSERMGLLSYTGSEENVFVGREMGRGASTSDHSEQTSREIDEEIRLFIDTAENKARELLSTHRDKLELFGNTLLDKETMSAMEIYELLEIPPPPALVQAAAEAAEAAETAKTAAAEAKSKAEAEPPKSNEGQGDAEKV
jgi:cell division protease FtsH